jgi:DNA-binding MarR family transcriptional regulator
MPDSKSPYCTCLYFSASAFARAMTRLADEAFHPVGLAPSHALLLLSVNAEPGIQPGALARLMQLQPSTVTRLLEKLEAKKLVERKTDGRAARVYPTPAGLALNRPIQEAWHGLYERYGSVLGTEAGHDLATRLTEAATRIDQRA